MTEREGKREREIEGEREREGERRREEETEREILFDFKDIFIGQSKLPANQQLHHNSHFSLTYSHSNKSHTIEREWV